MALRASPKDSERDSRARRSGCLAALNLFFCGKGEGPSRRVPVRPYCAKIL